MTQTNHAHLTFQEKQYVDVASSLSGQPYDIDQWHKQGQQQQYLEDQTKQIAEKIITEDNEWKKQKQLMHQ